MFMITKHTLVLKVVIVIISFAFAAVGFSAGVNSARIIPNGRVLIIKNGNVVGEFSKEVPLPKGVLLKCEEKCAVKMTDAYMVAEPDTLFSVSPMTKNNELMVQEGTVYFSVTESSPPIQFTTPDGVATTRETTLTGSELKGYVRVSPKNTTWIGVIDGGTMKVATSSGEMAISPGEQIIIAQANPNPSNPANEEEEGSSLATDVALGVAGTAVIFGGGYLIYKAFDSGGDGNDGGVGSPASP
jgi:hypothetical protein